VRRFARPQVPTTDSNPTQEQVRLGTYIRIDQWGDADDGGIMTDLFRCEAARYPMPIRTESDQDTAGATSRNLRRTSVTLFCAAALVALAVVVTMLPFLIL
jgi:hypothetical protein